MQRWHLFSLIVVLTLMVATLNPYSGSKAVEARAAELTVAGQNANSTVTPEEPAAPSATVTADSGTFRNHVPSTCSVTVPQDPPFIAPPPNTPYVTSTKHFWYGTDSLWTMLPKNGTWSLLHQDRIGYRQKVFWWRKGYFWTDEPEPQLHVTGRRLDAPAPPPDVSKATNAFAEDIQSAMLVGVDFPTVGCWEITGRYAGTELKFVVWVAR